MKETIENLALWLATEYCKKYNIDCSDTHLERDGRYLRYKLIKNGTEDWVASVRLKKHCSPEYTTNRDFVKA